MLISDQIEESMAAKNDMKGGEVAYFSEKSER